MRENVEVAALGAGVGPASRPPAGGRAPRFGFGSTSAASAPAGSLAHGDERRLGVARALATEPRFVLMDEPAAGLPEAEVPDFAAVVRSVRDDHDAGVLLIDHNMALDHGRLRPDPGARPRGDARRGGSPGEIRANLDVAAAYLGESAVHEEAE